MDIKVKITDQICDHTVVGGARPGDIAKAVTEAFADNMEGLTATYDDATDELTISGEPDVIGKWLLIYGASNNAPLGIFRG